jgi:hypothetical protein
MSRLSRKLSGLGWLIIVILTITSVLPDPLDFSGSNQVLAASRRANGIGDTSDDDFDVARHLRVLPPDYGIPKLLRLPVLLRRSVEFARDANPFRLSIFELTAVYLI